MFDVNTLVFSLFERVVMIVLIKNCFMLYSLFVILLLSMKSRSEFVNEIGLENERGGGGLKV